MLGFHSDFVQEDEIENNFTSAVARNPSGF